MNRCVQRWRFPIAVSLAVNLFLFARAGEWFLREPAIPSKFTSDLHVRIVNLPVASRRVVRETKTAARQSPAHPRELAHAARRAAATPLRERSQIANAAPHSHSPQEQSSVRDPFEPEIAPSATLRPTESSRTTPVSQPSVVSAQRPVIIANTSGQGYAVAPVGANSPAPTISGSPPAAPSEGGEISSSGAGSRSLPFGLSNSGGSGDLRVVYLLDVSPSMASRIDRARQELMASLRSLTQDDLFDIFVFGGNVVKMEDYLEPATPDDIAEAHRFLSHGPIPSTDLEAAVSSALRMDHVNEIVLITDGEPTMGETDPKILVSEIRNRNYNHVRIDAVGLVGIDPNGADGSFDAASLLRSIAHDSGGDFKLVPLGLPDSD